MSKINRKLIFIPTYNEAQNVGRIFEEIDALDLNTDFLFLDDNSPDGTGGIIDGIAKKNEHVYTIHRQGKQGIGSAHMDGIMWAYNRGYDTLITMDCDFSHSPGYLPEFIKNGEEYNIVIGSRYKKENSLKGWSIHRKILTHLGHFLTKLFLKMPHDATGAFRVYSLSQIPLDVFKLIQSKGYSFFFESLYILNCNQFSIKEIPIELPSRTYGHSKMSWRDAFQSLVRLVKTFWRTKAHKETIYYRKKTKEINESGFIADEKPYIPNGTLNAQQIEKEWDIYWNKKKGSSGALYDFIAVFYRKYIIKRTLNKHINRNFKSNSLLLHAGCGSGQVDTDVTNMLNVAAMDISWPALEIYRKYNPKVFKLVHGDIFNIPEENEKYDGIYNLGVMEHFYEGEIIKILNEFNRVLKPDGKIVLFWPPEFGLSVMFLKAVHFILNNIFNKNIKLHPDEVCRVKSKEQIKDLLLKANFHIEYFSFGLDDLFTHAIIVATKLPVGNLKKVNS